METQVLENDMVERAWVWTQKMWALTLVMPWGLGQVTSHF